MTLQNLFTNRYPDFSEFHIGSIIPQVSLFSAFGVRAGGPLGVWIGQKVSSRTTIVIYSVFLSIFIIKKALSSN